MASKVLTDYSSGEHLYQEYTGNPPDVHQIDDTMPESIEEKTCLKKFQTKLVQFGTCFTKMKLEMVAFLFMFSYTMTKISSTSMIIDKVCLVHLKYPSNICDDLDNNTDVKSAVEKLAINYQLVHTLIQTVPAAVVGCLIAPWSDHYGRKFPIILAVFGMILGATGSTVCAYFLESRVEYYFIPAAFTGIFGGPVAILAVVYSYASDSTPPLQRTMKYAFLEMATGFSIPLGSAAGGWIAKFLGYPAVFLFSTGGLTLSLVGVVFLLQETRGLDNRDAWSIKLRNLFSCKSFTDSFIAVTKNRPHQGQKQILLLLVSMCFLVIALKSTGDIDYLFAHHQFGWDNATYSTMTSIYTVIAVVLIILIIPILRRYRVEEPILGLSGTASLLGKNIGVGLAYEKWIFHFANLFGGIGGIASFAVRSRISRVVSDEDLGKVFTFVATAESILPILASIMMSQIFKATLDMLPGTPYIILALLLLLPLGIFIWMCCLPKMRYGEITHKPEENLTRI